jgi:PncC family amidohydrolase
MDTLPEGIEQEIGILMIAQSLTLATAESCTGGLVAHRITNVPGSSAYYLGGFVTYSNEAKRLHLGVADETLLAHGAVSEETALEMARGARQRMGADVALSVTGIAGPTGGTVEKPVGLVYVALSAFDAERCERHVWQGYRGEHVDRDNRLANKEHSASAALSLLLAYLQERGR